MHIKLEQKQQRIRIGNVRYCFQENESWSSEEDDDSPKRFWFRESRTWTESVDSEDEGAWVRFEKAEELDPSGYSWRPARRPITDPNKIRELNHALKKEKGKLKRIETKRRNIRRFPRRRLSNDHASMWDLPSLSQVRNAPKEWLIDGLILKGTINLLTAPPGGYKTWLGLAMGQAVATGSPILGFETVETPVLYLDRENPAAVIQDRCRILRLGSENFRIWGRWLDFAPPDIDDDRLLEIARNYKPLIIFDSFVRFHGEDENSAQKMATVMARLRELADAGATILILHHSPKTTASKYRGSSDILAGVDAAFELEETKMVGKSLNLMLSCYKHRVVAELEIPIEVDWEKGLFKRGKDARTLKASAQIEKIKHVISEHPGITQKKLMKKADIPESNGRQILRDGTGQHWQTKRGDGKTLHYHPI